VILKERPASPARPTPAETSLGGGAGLAAETGEVAALITPAALTQKG
jgi:hypothetical protein